MQFKSPLIQKITKRITLARNNSILLLEEAQENNLLDQKLILVEGGKGSNYNFQPIIFQFQCLVSTTDTYLRKLKNHNNQDFGLLENGELIKKVEINISHLDRHLKNQLMELQNVLKEYDNKELGEEIEYILRIAEHEYLHQGQLITMFDKSK